MNEHSDREVTAFNEALELPRDQRAAYLDRACAGDPAMRLRVERMLNSHEQVGGFLENPAAGVELSASVPIVPSVSSSQSKEKAGDRIGRHKLLQQIGEGGCGVVYMAEQEEPIRRKVALKVIKLGMDTKSVIARFEAERQALAMMDHPNIARVLDAGATETGRPFFVMELVRGIRITEYCDQNNLSTRERLNLFTQVCQAIQHAHQKGIIHRDIKPSNILVTINDGVPVPKVIDFGIAKATQGRLTNHTLFTAFEQFLGTPAYMSPEQAVMTSIDVDTRSDVYSLGVLLYELLTGQTPFDGKALIQGGLDELRRTIREREPVRPSTRLSSMGQMELTTTASRRSCEPPKLIHSVRGDLDWIVMKCLEKDRNRRYETANGLARDIQRHLGDEPILARPPGRLYLAQKLIRRNKLVFAAASAVTTALVIGLGVSMVLFFRERTASRRAISAEAVQSQLRIRAEAATTEARMTLENSDFAQALRLIAEDNGGDALAYLARILSNDPTNSAALTRMATLLTYHSWMVPTLTITHRDVVSSAQFSPDGKFIVTGSWDHSARISDAQSGQAVNDSIKHADALELPGCVDMSPDGKSIVTASVDNSARVWDARTGLPQCPALNHNAPVRSARFSPDGRWVVTASQDGTARIWEAQSGRAVITLKHEGWVVSAEFSPDGTKVVTASYDNKARIWDAHSGQLLCPPLEHQGWVNAAQFSPDGNEVVTASYDGTARVWDAQSGLPITPPAKHSDRVRCVQFSPDGRRFVTGSYDGTAHVWDARTGVEQTPPLKHGKAVMSVQFSPDGSQILTASWDRTARIWDARNGQPITGPMKQHGALSSARFSPDGQKFVTAAQDSTAQIWQAESSPARDQPLQHQGKVWSAHFSPDGTRIVTASEDHSAVIWDALTGKPIGEPLKHNSAVRTAQFSPDGKRILTASNDKTARIWDAVTSQPLTVPMTHKATIRVASFSADGKLVITGSEDNTARVWDALTGQPVTGPLNHSNWVNSVQFSPDGNRVVTASSDHTARLWDAHSGRLLAECVGHSLSLVMSRFSPDGKRIVTTSYDGTARVWDAFTGQPVINPLRHENAVYRLQFSPDGAHFVTASADQKARVWDIMTGRSVIPPLEHGDALNSAQFSSDGRWIVTASDDHTARVWDAATGRPVTDGLQHGAEVLWAEFSPDGRRVVTMAGDAAHVWDVAPATPSCPDWLLPLAEAISGEFLNDQGILEETKLNRPEILTKIRQRLDREPNDDAWIKWGRWFLSDLAARTIAPYSKMTLRERIEGSPTEKGNAPPRATAAQDTLEEAESVARTALVEKRRQFPSDPAKWQSDLKNLAAVLRRQQRFDEVAKLMKDALPATSTSNLLINGSFELGSFAAGNDARLLPEGSESGGGEMSVLPGGRAIIGWTVVGPPGADLEWAGPGNSTSWIPPDGSFSLDLTGYQDVPPYCGVSQSLATTVGQVYALSFDVGSDAAWDHSILPCVEVAITGNPTTIHTVDAVGFNRWQTFEFNFTATATNTTLTIRGANTNGLAYIGLDNVRVRAADTSPSAQK